MPVLIVREQVDEAAIAEAMRLGAQDVVTLANRSRLQSVATPRAARAPPGAGAVDDAVLGARVSRAAAEIPRRVGRRDHARAGRHHRRCQSGLARAVRLFRRRCAHRHAAHGSVRAGYPSRAEGRAGRLPAGQVDGPRPQGSGAAVGRLQPAAGALAHQGELRERARDAHQHSGEQHARITISRCSWPTPSRTMPPTRFLQQRYLRRRHPGALRATRRRAACASSPTSSPTASPRSRAPSACSRARTSWRSSPSCCACS